MKYRVYFPGSGWGGTSVHATSPEAAVAFVKAQGDQKIALEGSVLGMTQDQWTQAMENAYARPA